MRKVLCAGVFALGCSSQPAPPWPLPDVLRTDVEHGFSHKALEHVEEAHRARARVTEDPGDLDAAIWFGRRVAYLGDHEGAIAIYSRALHEHPDSAKLLRHRGHRLLSLERFDAAITDLSRASRLIAGTADEVEPDGLPNARNQPTSTLHTNIYYHLGLAWYNRGDFEAAASNYERCLLASRNRDMESAARYWLCLIFARTGQLERLRQVLEPVRADWDIIENRTYHSLLLLFRGEIAVADIAKPIGDAIQSHTLTYGLARHALHQGERRRADRALREVASRDSTAFGCLAARADLAR